MQHGKKKSTVLDVSHRIYEASLIFYVKDFRGEFGSEMIEVFDQQVSEAYSRSGLAGLLRVCFRATREMVTVGLPGRFAGRAISIVAVTATLVFMFWFASYIGYVMEAACPGCRH